MTLNELTYFTVVGNFYDAEAPPLTSGDDITPQFLVISAFVEFTARLAPGDLEYIQNLDLLSTVAPPTGLSVTGSSTGGTLAAGAYDWEVTAINANGETTPSNEVTATLTGSTSSAALSWSFVDDAAGYKVYRKLSSGSFFLITTINTPTTLTYTDTGTTGTSATPPSTNSAEMSGNTALALAPIQARIFNGQLETIDQADTPNIQLVANSSILGLATNALIYDVAFSDVVYATSAQTLKNFAFTAPSTATTVDLGDPNLTRLDYNPDGYTQ